MRIRHFVTVTRVILVVTLLVQWFSVILLTTWRLNKAESSITQSDIEVKRATDNTVGLITFFTTFKRSQGRFFIYTNTLSNWPTLAGDSGVIQAILFQTENDFLLKVYAKWNGWLVLQAPRTNKFGTPHLKEMFSSALAEMTSTFCGYANGDILFTDGLMKTLVAVHKVLPSLGQILIVGRRRNFNMASHKGRLYTSKQVESKYKFAKDAGPVAIDYFIISQQGFPWGNVPDIVIGRPGYDNFLLRVAKKHNVSVIDATRTIVALHQTGSDGDHAGFSNDDVKHNYKVIGKHYKYFSGNTDSAQYETSLDANGSVQVWFRSGSGKRQILPPSSPHGQFT